MNAPQAPAYHKRTSFDTELVEQADGFKALSHPARLALLLELAQQGTCVCGELVTALPLSQATVSRHLGSLLEAGLVTVMPQKTCSCYALSREGIELLQSLHQRFFIPLNQSIVMNDCCGDCC